MLCAHEQRQQRVIAYHEAGHALVAQTLDYPVQYVTIEPSLKDGTLGHCRCERLPRTQRRRSGITVLGELATISAGGLVAQRIAFPRSPRDHARGDLASIDDAASVVCAVGAQGAAPPEQRRPFERRAFAEARRILAERWWEVHRVAERLIEDRQLSGFSIARIARDAASEWAQLSEYNRGMTAVEVMRHQARARKPKPPLSRRHVEGATLRAVTGGARDIRRCVHDDLIARGFGSTEITTLWERIAHANT